MKTKTKIALKSPRFSNIEAAVLSALYEVGSNGSFDSYGLARKLKPQAKGKAEKEAFDSVLDATENLIASGLVRGRRIPMPTGIYFSDLNLRSNGVSEAIKEQKRPKFVEWKNPDLSGQPVRPKPTKPTPVFDDKKLRKDSRRA